MIEETHASIDLVATGFIKVYGYLNVGFFGRTNYFSNTSINR
ncbi:hypothetical protein [Enterovibrio norvegicus]